MIAITNLLLPPSLIPPALDSDSVRVPELNSVSAPKTEVNPVITPTVPSSFKIRGAFAVIGPDMVEAIAVNPATPLKPLPSPE